MSIHILHQKLEWYRSESIKFRKLKTKKCNSKESKTSAYIWQVHHKDYRQLKIQDRQLLKKLSTSL